ncbi:unnamed protein product [Clonostachys rosea]|uniref:Uncharacterized protein n=1 Tax=Bionectria ochroleuca TaxID=29856 RepID=A0ABY6U3H4_BIOOC|nr:unnamed protein product [Clonostachys rosea]
MLTGAVSPAFIIITSLYYKRREDLLCTATWISMSGVSQTVGALMILLHEWHSLLSPGALTSGLRVLFVIVVPRDTKTAWFLSEQERQIAAQRLTLDRGTRDRKEFNTAQAKEVFLAPTTWIYFLWSLSTPVSSMGSGMTNIRPCLLAYRRRPELLNVLGRSSSTTLLPEREGIYQDGTLPRATDWGHPSLSIASQVRMGYRCRACLVSSAASIITINVKGNTKRSVVSTGFFVSFCVGSTVNPQAWTEEEAPRHTKGCVLSITSLVVSMSAYAVYRFIISRENKRRDVKEADRYMEYSPNHVNSTAGVNVDGVDGDSNLTEIQDRGFRYIL